MAAKLNGPKKKIIIMFFLGFFSNLYFHVGPLCIFLWDQDPDNLYHVKVVKDVGQVGNHEIILIGNRKIKRQRICHDIKTTNFNSREFKWGYSNSLHSTYLTCT